MTTVLSRTIEGAAIHTNQPHLTLNTTLRGVPAAVPNKHLPYCSPGPQPLLQLASSPASPPASPPIDLFDSKQSAILLPSAPTRLLKDPPVYSASAAQLASALHHLASQPLPDPNLVFPWLHGLHPDNHVQLSFLNARRKPHRKVPTCLRGLTIVKAGGDLSTSKLKGAVALEELSTLGKYPSFHDADPPTGFSVRNFQIQACKMATLSDLVVYGDERTSVDTIMETAKTLAAAQKVSRQKDEDMARHGAQFHTYVILDAFATFESSFPDLVAADATGKMTGTVLDFPHQERLEMRVLSQASEIAKNVWLGPTPEYNTLDPDISDTTASLPYDILIETNDFARMPDAHTLFRTGTLVEHADASPQGKPVQLELPSSGSISQQTCRSIDVDRFVAVCKWIYALANGTRTKRSSQNRPTSRSKAPQSTPPPTVAEPVQPQRRVLIHCADGYTETSLLAIAYMMFAEGIPAHRAWIRMHKEKGRNFFAYPADKTFLQSVQSRLLQESPALRKALYDVETLTWMEKMDGSLPSRILPYLYLGNLNHAQNPGLLKEMGISRVLSVGEPISWTKDELSTWGTDNLLFIDKVQDNGVDPLTDEFDHCLQFIGK